MSGETWLPVTGWEDLYLVSDQGRVRSLPRRRSAGRILKPTINPRGYGRVDLWDRSRVQKSYVHRLVAIAFLGGDHPGLQVCHFDGDPANNHVNNLRWDTPSANLLDAVRHGTHPTASRTHCPRGHALVEPNLVPSQVARGWRSCLACCRARNRKAADPGAVADRLYAELAALL